VLITCTTSTWVSKG